MLTAIASAASTACCSSRSASRASPTCWGRARRAAGKIRINDPEGHGEGGSGWRTLSGGPITGGLKGHGAPEDRATGEGGYAHGRVMRTVPECTCPPVADAPARAEPAPWVW